MAISKTIKLDNYEDEDIFDIVIKLEKSFDIEFEKDAFLNVKTFGDLCDVIESHIKYEHKEDCTKQQAFYKIRTAISETQLIDKKTIHLNTKLIYLFPRRNRRRQAKMFQRHLGVPLNFLTYPGWLALILVIGFVASLIAFFIDWKVAISGIATFIIALTVADKLGKDLAVETVRELTEIAAAEHYTDTRRCKFTINKNEILEIIKEAFSRGLAIEKEELTRDSKFSWA